jgi:hypothetical protein
MKKIMTILLIIIGVVLLGWFLYPKEAGYTDAGHYIDGAEVTSQTSSCFGYSYTEVGSSADMFYNYCIGIPYNKKYVTSVFGESEPEDANNSKMGPY